MSHFSAIQTRITNKATLIATLKGISTVQQVKENWYVRGYGNNTPAAIVAVLEGGYDLGFRWNQTTAAYEAVADFGMGSCGDAKNSASLMSLWQRVVAAYKTAETLDAAQATGIKGNVNVRVIK